MNEILETYRMISNLYRSVLRGNEIEFQYNNKNYYILPNYKKK